MSQRGRVARKLLKTFLPIVLIILLAVVIGCGLIVYTITRPPSRPYLVTPKTFAVVTGPILNAVDATWKNHDGTDARGWLIQGNEGSPAVILLHGYGADRSWLLNFAVKLNETTNFTVLWPDLRGHGQDPLVKWTLFGAVEGDDVTAAIDHLRSLKGPSGKQLVGPKIGVYGIGLGAYAALDGAHRYPEIRAIALDSPPASPDDLVDAATNSRMGMNNGMIHRLARWGMKVYALGKYQPTPSCDLARSVKDVRALLLTGPEGDAWRPSTIELARCFNPAAEVRKDLAVTGANLPSSTGEQEESYDRPVIEFFDKSLR